MPPSSIHTRHAFAFLLVAWGPVTQPLTAQVPGQRTDVSIVRTGRAASDEAIAAVEADRVEAQGAVWRQALERDPTARLPQLGLAALALYTYDFDAAEAGYRAIVDADPELSDPLALYAVVGLASVLVAQQQRTEADAWAERLRGAAATRDLVTLEVEALIILAGIRAGSQGPVAAVALLDSADARVEPVDTLLSVYSMCSRGRLLVQAGTQPAVALAEEGAGLARAIGNRRAEAQCLQIKIHDFERRGLYVEAFPVLEEIEELHTATRNPYGLTWVQQVWGQMLSQYGLFGPGMERTQDALRNAEALGDRSVQAWANLVLSYMAVRLDDPVLAMEYGQEAEVILEELDDRLGQANLRALQGDAASLAGDLSNARAAYQEASELVRTVNPVSMVHLRRRQASIARRMGDVEGAARLLATADSLARVFDAVDHQLWGQSYEQGLLAMADGDLPSAEARFRTVLERLPEGMNQYQNQIDAQARLAEVLALRGDLSGSAEELGRAFDQLDEWRSTMDERQFRLSVLHAQNLDWDRDLGLARILGELARAGRVETALALSERQRARVLNERTLRRASLADDVSTVLGELEQARDTPGAATAVGTDGLPGTTLPEFDVMALSATIPAGTAIVSYVTDQGGDRTTGFLVSANGITSFDLPPADSLSSDIGRLTTLLEAGAPAGLLGRSLAESVLDPILEALPEGVARLVIVPDGPLHRVPFDALVLEDGRMVLERFTVTLSPSVAFAVGTWAAESESVGESIVAFGNPMLGKETSAAQFPPLPGATREARMVARHGINSDLLLGERATEAALKARRFDGVSVLHFAAHAVVADRSVVRTALMLAPGEGDDGYVHPHELAGLTLNVDLVVLSACRTAQGATLTGEGVQGLTAPLLEAGARAVVASYWPLGDQSAVPLISDFYDRLSAGASAAEALREAKLGAWRAGVSPNVWSALTLVGDGEVRPRLSSPRPGRLWLIPVIVLLPLAIWLRRSGTLERAA